MKKLEWNDNLYNREISYALIRLPEWCLQHGHDDTGRIKVALSYGIFNPNSIQAVFWAFNRGITIFNEYEGIGSLEDAKILAESRIKQLFAINQKS